MICYVITVACGYLACSQKIYNATKLYKDKQLHFIAEILDDKDHNMYMINHIVIKIELQFTI